MVLREDFFFCNKYYISSVEIKNLNVIIDNKSLFEQPRKKTNKKRIKNQLKCEETMIIQSGTYWITCIIKNARQKKNAPKLVRIDLSRKTNTNISQQVNFVGRLEQNIGTKEIFIAEKQQETISNFSLDLIESAK